MTPTELVEKFQCPGCVCGMNSQCGAFKYDADEMRCTGHVLGTLMTGAGHLALGLPRGFCRPGFSSLIPIETHNRIGVRLWTAGTAPVWDKFNVPVWALIQDGFLFVRTLAPRIALLWTDVIEGGSLAMVPTAINVAEFYDDLD